MSTINRLDERAKKRTKKNESVTNSSDKLLSVIGSVIEEVSQNDALLNSMRNHDSEDVLKAEIERIMGLKNYSVPGYSRGQLLKQINDYMFKYAMIQEYLDDPECNNVMINRYDNVWIQIRDKRIRIDLNFGSEENLMTFIRSIQASLGGKLDQNHAVGKFADEENKLRIEIIVSPISLQGPIVMIRKHRRENYSMDDLIRLGMMSKCQADYLIKAANDKKSIVWCGSGSSGKTTCMRATIEELHEDYRILTMEERPELFLKHPGVVALQIRRDSGVRYGVEHLADEGLLMSIDYYVYGEIRRSEALALFDGAMSGNPTFTTTHAKSPENAFDKLMINMKRSGTDIPSEVLKEMLYESIDLIVMMKNFKIDKIVTVKGKTLVPVSFETKYEIKEEIA